MFGILPVEPYAGVKKYGESANLPTGALKKRGATSSPSPRSSRGRDERSSLLEGRGEGQSTGGGSSSPSPLAGPEASEARSRGRGGGPRVPPPPASTSPISTKCTA